MYIWQIKSTNYNIAKNKFEWVFIIIFVICAEPQRQHKLPIKQSLWASLTCQNICASMLQTKQDKTSLPCLASLPMEYITIFKLQDSPFKKERVVRRNSTARWLANSKKKKLIVVELFRFFTKNKCFSRIQGYCLLTQRVSQ